MIEIIIITTVLAYAGLHVHLYMAAKPLKRIASIDKERTAFVVEKMLHASKTSGVLCQICSRCKRVVHKYDLHSDGTVVCHDCKSGISHR